MLYVRRSIVMYLISVTSGFLEDLFAELRVLALNCFLLSSPSISITCFPLNI